ncbi:hypothetical protein BaRGS_00017736 [Batillaria attramentaria]|uniref:Uncharacterized protein n=1 Tax=Batillaria attramentaria TaxID=370345 RepID=A0ABD0KV44_9CAEN
MYSRFTAADWSKTRCLSNVSVITMSESQYRRYVRTPSRPPLSQSDSHFGSVLYFMCIIANFADELLSRSAQSRTGTRQYAGPCSLILTLPQLLKSVILVQAGGRSISR